MTAPHQNLSVRVRSRKPRKRWTPATRALAAQMAVEGALRPEIALATGMAVSSVTAPLAGTWRPSRRKIHGKQQKAGYRSTTGLYAASQKSISPAAEEERTRRLAAAYARDFTAVFFGDPPRGYSALDGKTGQQ